MEHSKFLVFTLFLYSLSQIPWAISSERGATNALVVETKSNENHRISIVVIKAGDTSVGVLEDGEDGGEEDGESVVDAESTDHQFCQGNRCCYQFTWLGFVTEIPTDPENSTCEYLRKEKKYDGMACFDPIVYTSPVDETSSAVGRGPNVTLLTHEAEVNDWNIFCPLTQDKTCLTLKYFARGGGKQVVNETRFCGSITETGSGSRVNSGCFTEKVQGYFREVCSCTTSFCNLGSRNNPTIIWFMISIAASLSFTQIFKILY